MTPITWYILAIYRPDVPDGRIRIVKAQGLSAAIQVREGEAFQVLEEEIDPSAWHMVEGVLTPLPPP